MMEGYLRVEMHAHEHGPGTVECGVWQEVRRYGHAGDQGYLTPWWCVEGWRPGRGNQTAEDVVALVQRGHQRLEESKAFMRQMTETRESSA